MIESVNNKIKHIKKTNKKSGKFRNKSNCNNYLDGPFQFSLSILCRLCYLCMKKLQKARDESRVLRCSVICFHVDGVDSAWRQ